jgi:hypothetical protein
VIAKLKRMLAEAGKRIAVSVHRFPEALVFSVALAVVLMVLNHYENSLTPPMQDLIGRLAMVFAIGIPLGLCRTMIFERWALGRLGRTIVYAVYGASLVCYYLWLSSHALSLTEGIRFAGLFIASYVAFVVIPYVWRREHFEKYVLYLVFRFAVTYLFSLVIVGGNCLMIVMINLLFDLQITEKIYLDIALVTAGFFTPAFFLTYVPSARRGDAAAEDQLDETVMYPKVLEILLANIVMPILLAYAAILYVYLFTILLTLEWPRGVVSNLVLWFALVSAVVLFFSYPLRGRNRWTGWFVTYFPWILVPLIVLMLVAVGIRVNAYGLTENRYFVIAGGVWLILVMAAYMARLRMQKLLRLWHNQVNNVVLMALLAVIMLFSVVGPWSSMTMSAMSQNARLAQILTQYNLLADADGRLIKPEGSQYEVKLSEADQASVSSILSYFRNNHEERDVRVLPAGVTIEDVLSWLQVETLNDYFYYSLNEGNRVNVFAIENYEWMLDFTGSYYGDANGVKSSLGEYEVAYDGVAKRLSIHAKGSDRALYQRNVLEVAEAVARNIRQAQVQTQDSASADANSNSQINRSAELFTFGEVKGPVSVRYVFTNISGNRAIDAEGDGNGDGNGNGTNTGNNGLRVDQASFYLYVSVRE